VSSSPEGKLVIHDSEGNVDKDETITVGKSLREKTGGVRVFIPVLVTPDSPNIEVKNR